MLRQFSIGLAGRLLNIAISPSSATPCSGTAMSYPLPKWRLIGPMAGMNGVLLFGWSTAVMFEVLRKVQDR